MLLLTICIFNICVIILISIIFDTYKWFTAKINKAQNNDIDNNIEVETLCKQNNNAINFETNFSFIHNYDIVYSLTFSFQHDKKLFSLEKFQNDVSIYSSGDKNHKISKRLYYILDNVKKMKDGKIREYMIFNELEIEVLSRYLSQINVSHVFYISNETENIKLDLKKFKDDINTYSDYFMRRRDKKIEYNKINNNYKLKIKIYKGYDNLSNKKSKRLYTRSAYM